MAGHSILFYSLLPLHFFTFSSFLRLTIVDARLNVFICFATGLLFTFDLLLLMILVLQDTFLWFNYSIVAGCILYGILFYVNSKPLTLCDPNFRNRFNLSCRMQLSTLLKKRIIYPCNKMYCSDASKPGSGDSNSKHYN